MRKKLSKFVVTIKKYYYFLYYNFGGYISFRNIIYFTSFACRTICHVISDYLTWNVESVYVNVEEGRLRGRKVQSVLGDTFCSFRGVRYAKAPVGRFRFKDPEPPESWTGTRKAFRHGNVSAQWDWLTRLFIGKEDSLVLNIYSPQLRADNDASSVRKAVLLWIHGGAFSFGFSNDVLYGPDLFMSEDVILVTVNYRLGPLGFLTTGTADAPGNAGFKDVIQALQWVKRNIGFFGGDPGNVTVFGESAGACMAETLMVSPIAKGLFHKIISQSGNSSTWWGFSNNLVDSSFKLAKNLGIHTDNPKMLVERLQKLSARSICLQQRRVLSEERLRQSTPFEFSLCAEPEDYPNAALTADPGELLRQGKFVSDVPFMTGLNEKEGLAMLHTVLMNYPEIEELDKNFERFVPYQWNLKIGSEESKKVADEIRKFYINGKPISKCTYDGIVNLASDLHFLPGFNTSTTSHQKYLKSPVYTYLFAFDGYRNIYKKAIDLSNIKGPSHSDEAFYLFHVPGLGKGLKTNCREAAVAKRMVRLWCNFAKYGNPTPNADDDLLQKKLWPPAKKESSPHIIIGDDLSISNDVIWKERAKFWEDLKAKYAPNA